MFTKSSLHNHNSVVSNNKIVLYGKMVTTDNNVVTICFCTYCFTSEGSSKATEESKPIEPYNRTKHYGYTPKASDRKAIGGESVDHDPPLVKRYYEGDPKTGEKPGYQQTPEERKASANDRSRMKPATKAEQNKQGGEMSQYSKEKKKEYGF